MVVLRWNQFYEKELTYSVFSFQVGVQTEVEPDAGANALEDRVNAVLPLQMKEEDEMEMA